jgi:predicted DCC family thiol-disulfide oxidoreductase YuxK
MTKEPLLHVFYDGVCPLCAREIAHYRKLKGAELIEWVEIHSQPERLKQEQLDFATARARFHIRDAGGHWHIGAHGFIALWSVINAYRPLAWLIRTLHLGKALNALYVRFADWRLKRQSACKL